LTVPPCVISELPLAAVDCPNQSNWWGEARNFPRSLLLPIAAGLAVKKEDITQVVNGRVDCVRCHASDAWKAAARVAVRQYSSIHRLRCAHCGEQIVVKVVVGKYSNKAALVHARKEYEALCTLQTAFPQDERFGTLAPVGHFEHNGCGIVVTRLAPGDDLMHYVRGVDANSAQVAWGSAGIWLKKLHESDPQNRKRPLEAADKISTLVATYGSALQAEPKTAAAYELFIREGANFEAMAVDAVRQHGDFKPDNMLCDGTRYIGLDIRWRCIGAAVYDLAPFLNHLWLDLSVTSSSRKIQLYDVAESAFLSGYGGAVDMRALRWVQLYFALCYMGGYRKRGQLATVYANWKVRPLVRRLATQLEGPVCRCATQTA
jgi:aminoglycoside phosphotransferase